MSGLLAMTMGFALNAASPHAPCLGFYAGPHGLTGNSMILDSVYGPRAVEVMQAATSADSAKLAGSVSPDARYDWWRGDSGTDFQSRGVEGAIEFAAWLKPISYRRWSVFSGPISGIYKECRWTVELLFQTNVDEGALVAFDFADGLLVKAAARDVVYHEGPMPPVAVR